MNEERSYHFTHAIVRTPSHSVISGLRDGDGKNPNAARFRDQHAKYVATLQSAGATIIQLPALEEYPDSVFVEDTTLCLPECAITLRPGAPSRTGETDHIKTTLMQHFKSVLTLPEDCYVDGGDILLGDHHAFIGLSKRTNLAGFEAVASIISEHRYTPIRVDTPPHILHFKTDCGLLDSNTILATKSLAATGCFDGYNIIEVPEGEEAAANIVRYNDAVLLNTNAPRTEALLLEAGFNVLTLDTSEAARIDGGLSCMSLRFKM